jgi:predicted ester cyclase
MVSLLTDNVKINSISFGDYKGKKGAREYWQKLFDTFPDIELKVVTMTADGNRLVTEISFSGTQKGQSQIYGSSGLNKKFHLRGAFVYEFIDEKIGEIRMYYDSSVLKKQLKIMEL